jgi:hypothetical protein
MAMSAAVLLGLAAGATPPATRPPIFLTAEERAGHVTVQVRGATDGPFAGSYTLQTVSGGNRTQQSGQARLGRHDEATFITVNLSFDGPWSAVLQVKPDVGPAYEQRLGTTAE